MVICGTADATCARIFSLDAIRAATAALTVRLSWRASVLRGRSKLGLRVWEYSTDHCCKQAVPNGNLWYSRGKMCSDFFPGCCSGCHRCSHSSSILTCLCTTRPFKTWSTGVGIFYRPLLKAATHHRYIVQQSFNMSIQLPAGLKCDPIQMAEVVQQEYILVRRAWLYPRVNVAPLKAPQLLLQSQNRGAKTDLLNAIWSPITVPNNSPTLQPLVCT